MGGGIDREVIVVGRGGACVRGCVGTIVIVIDGIVSVRQFMTEPVRKSEGFRHPLLSTEHCDLTDGVLRHGKRSPSKPVQPPPSTEAHEIVTPLFIAGRPKTDGTKGPSFHVIGVLLMGLGITAKLEANVFMIVKVPPSEKVPRRQCGGHPIGVRECVEPEHCIGHETHYDQTREAREGQVVVPAAHPILDGANIPLDVRDVLALGTKIKMNHAIKGLELGISWDGPDAEPASMIGRKHLLDGLQDSGDLAVRNGFNCPKVQVARSGQEKWDLVDEEDVNTHHQVTVSVKNVRWDTISSPRDHCGMASWGFPLESTKVGPKNILGGPDITPVDWAIP